MVEFDFFNHRLCRWSATGELWEAVIFEVSRPVRLVITRRATQRLLLLRPSQEINQVFLYCLALAAERFSVRVHAYCALSNHFHLVATDPEGKLPKFMRWLDGTLARCLNSYHARWENFWASGTYSRVELAGDADVLSKMVYTITNPVASGLVARSEEWPGARSGTLRNGSETITVKRPGFFFRKTGPLPEEASLVVVRPRAFPELSEEAFGTLLHNTVTGREEMLREDLRAAGKRFLGSMRVLKQAPLDRPGSREPRRGMNPRVAARDKWRRIERLQWLDSWLAAYAEALRRFTAGFREAVFPAGTYWMRVHHRVRCYAPP